MKTKIFILVFAIFISINAIGQENANKLDFRSGAGISFLGTGDMTTFNYENELNLKLNKYFTSSISLNLGRSNTGVFETASFVQGNLNVFISPFKNNKRFDFRIGTGLTYYNISDVREKIFYDEANIIYDVNKRNSLGYNIILENSYSITNKFLIGLKIFSQSYNNGDINNGVMLKFGLKI